MTDGAAGGAAGNVARSTELRLHGSLESALEHILDYAMVLTDLDRRIVGWNRGAELLLGYSAEEAEGQRADMFFTDEDRANGAPQHEVECALRTGKAVDERWHVRRDGSRFFGSGITTPAKGDRGNLLGLVKIFRDATEQRQAAQDLARSEERYRLLVDSIKDYAIYMLDADGRVTYWTKAAERIKGYSSSEIVGKPSSVFFTDEARERGEPERELVEARTTGRAEAVGWRVRKNGSWFWGDEVMTALHDASGTVTGFSKITRDDTERRNADLERERLLREAREHSRLKDEFLSTISHELRTPLNAVLGWTQLMRLQALDGEALAQGLEVIERNSRAQARLVEDLLDMSRIISGKIRLNLQPVTLAEALAPALQTVRPDAAEHGISLIVHHGALRDTVDGDVGRLQQVIWNILANAVKFTPRGGSITVTTTSTPDRVELTIADTGIGIEREFLPLVFDRFRQADTSSTRAHGGLGLGLAIVQHLVEAHAGIVTVDSEGPQRGTTVRLSLPLYLDEVHADVPRVVNHVPHALRTTLPEGTAIVVVDDEPDARRMLALELERRGADVRTAASTRECVDLVQHTPPQIVLADLAMPVDDGLSLVRQLRNSGDPAVRSIPVVAITSLARPEDRMRCLAAGFNAYLAKPVDLAELINVIAHMVDEPPALSMSH